MKNGKNHTCPLSDEIVSYIYGEISGKTECDFERHIAECAVCTDEFASIADSRFSVFEWKKEAFDPLPTPLFQVPYEVQTQRVENGLVGAVKAWAESFSIPITVAVSIALVVGVWLIIFALGEKQEQPVAVHIDRPVVQPESKAESTVPTVAPPTADRPDLAEVARPAKRGVKAIPTSTAQKRRPLGSPAIIAEKKPLNNSDKIPQIQKAPALTAYQDNDDESLRLAELFDEVGG